MRIPKGKVIIVVKIIIIALVCIFGGAHASLAGQSRSDCEAPGHFSRTCHCHPKDDFARYRAHLIGPFETEYDVEKWEKALRQGLATKSRENFRTEGPHRPCREAWSNGWHGRALKYLHGPTGSR
jgi:hypothetical protein